MPSYGYNRVIGTVIVGLNKYHEPPSSCCPFPGQGLEIALEGFSKGKSKATLHNMPLCAAAVTALAFRGEEQGQERRPRPGFFVSRLSQRNFFVGEKASMEQLRASCARSPSWWRAWTGCARRAGAKCRDINMCILRVHLARHRGMQVACFFDSMCYHVRDCLCPALRQELVQQMAQEKCTFPGPTLDVGRAA